MDNNRREYINHDYKDYLNTNKIFKLFITNIVYLVIF